MIAVNQITDAASLADVRLLWESLWQRTRGASFVQSLDWLESYCKHFGRPVGCVKHTPISEKGRVSHALQQHKHFGRRQRLKVLIVSLAGKPIGILPLVVRRVASGFGAVRVLSYPLVGGATCYGPVGPNAAATLIAAMRHLRDSRRDWDVIDLDGVDVDRFDRGRTRNALRAAGMNCLARPGRTAAVVDLEPSWIEYWAGRPAGLRRRLYESEQRLLCFGGLQHERFRPDTKTYCNADCRSDLFDEIDQLCDPVDGRPSGRAFLRDAHACAVRAAALDLNLLRLDGRPVAAACGYHVDGQVDVVRLAAAADFADEARLLLCARMLKDGAFRGDRIYRFAAEGCSGVAEWQTGQLRTERLTHFAPSAPRAQLLRWNQRVQSWLGTIRRQPTATLDL